MSSDKTVTATFVSTPPRCKLSSTGKLEITHRHKNHTKRGRVTIASLVVAVTCNQAAAIRLTGWLTDAPFKSRGARNPRIKHFTLKASGTIRAGLAETFTLKLPAAALSDLDHHAKERIKLTLVARSPQGTNTTTITVTRLRI